MHLDVINALRHTLAELDARVGKALTPIRERARLLTTIPGVSDLTARVMVAEIGVDMTRFPDAGHLISWAGLCPRNDESAGKRRSTRVRKSGTWLKTALVTAAWAAVRVKKGYLRAQFLRIKARRGAKKAIELVGRMHRLAPAVLGDADLARPLGRDQLAGDLVIGGQPAALLQQQQRAPPPLAGRDGEREPARLAAADELLVHRGRVQQPLRVDERCQFLDARVRVAPHVEWRRHQVRDLDEDRFVRVFHDRAP